jgi:predicted metal-dependent peptidase
MFTRAKLSPEQERQVQTARVAFMIATPFYSHLFYSIAKEVPTRDVPSAATDGRHIFINPEYFCSLKTQEQVFVFAHEMSHIVNGHCQRGAYYTREGNIRGLPYSSMFANVCEDFVINADLVETGVGAINPDWLFDPSIKGSELWEDIYERLYQKPPPGQGQGQGSGGSGGTNSGSNQQPQGGARSAPQGAPQGSGLPTAGSTGKAPRGARGDPTARGKGGTFDEILPPPVDPATGAVDLPDANEFKEAVARALGAAKAMGNCPGSVQRLAESILDPQVDWRDHIRLLMTGKIGSRGETWTRPNRRRLALNPLVIAPGRRGYGCELVVVGIDTSGSIGARELDTFLAEVGGILNDCKPRQITVIGCDMRVTQVDEVASLDEFEGLRAKGVMGGGGTDFRPVFDHVDEHNLKPECLVYLTDMYGSFPDAAPAYPVIWAATTDVDAPWGEVVRIKVE